jgi:hypothetical protein
MRAADVDCPGCLQLEADRRARAAEVADLVERVERLEATVTELRERPERASADDVMTPSEVTDLLGINPKTLVTWANKGMVTCIQLPSGHRRYLRSEIEAYFRRSRSEFTGLPALDTSTPEGTT